MIVFEKPLLLSIIGVLIAFLAVSIYKNTQLKTEVKAVRDELVKTQEALLFYSNQKQIFLKKQEKALGILKNEDEDIVSKFNSINGSIF